MSLWLRKNSYRALECLEVFEGGHGNRPLGPYKPQDTHASLSELTGKSEVCGSSGSLGASQGILVLCLSLVFCAHLIIRERTKLELSGGIS